MPMPKMYVEEPEEELALPMPYLKINEEMGVEAVDEDGVHVAYIVDGDGYCECVEDALDTRRFASDWAEWDYAGRFVRLT
jgi:hypothetical protein